MAGSTKHVPGRVRERSWMQSWVGVLLMTLVLAFGLVALIG